MGIIGGDSSGHKTNWLHVDIFQFFSSNLKNILQIPLKRSVIPLKS